MADSRGIATKILRDMLNIGGERRVNPGEQTTINGRRNEEGEAEDSVSDSTSVSSSVSSPPRNTMSRISDLTGFDGDTISSGEVSTARLSLEPVKQTVQLNSSDKDNTVCIYGNQVEVVASDASMLTANATSSSKIKINPVVKYDWEPKYYHGNLIAHGSKFIAYTLKGSSGFVIRLLNPITATRALIKGFTGTITDLAFAHRNSNTLACVDEGGNLYIWSVYEEDGKINYMMKLIVERHSDALSVYHRLFWCPYMPDDSDEEENTRGQTSSNGVTDEADRPIAVTHDNEAEVIDLDVVANLWAGERVSIEQLKQKEGYVAITDGHSKPITDGALPPDGGVLTTASEDGFVKFWQVSDVSPDESPTCLHFFQPHNGAPVSSLMFCDNHLVQDKDLPMWRFMITGANYNRELKIWCTVTWNCLQTISFTVPPGTPLTPEVKDEPCIKVSLDLTASYLVLSDIKRKALCVFMLHQDVEEGRAHVTSLSEFLLTQPLLSFVIAKAKLYKQCSDAEQPDGNDLDDSDEFDDEMMGGEMDKEHRKNFGVQLRLYCIHTKSMQELLVHFHPEPSVPPATPSSVSSLMASEAAGIRDALSDLSGMETEASTDAEEPETVPEVEATTKPKLITPDAFTHTSSKRGARPDSANSTGSSVTIVTAVNTSQPSVDDHTASSISSNLSDSTLKSSMEETPQSSFAMDESPVMTPTSLPLPMTPVVGAPGSMTSTSLPLPMTPPAQVAPDPSVIPMPAFQSTPFHLAAKTGTEPERNTVPVEEQPEVQETPGSVEERAVGSISPLLSGEKDVEVEVEVEEETKESEVRSTTVSQESCPPVGALDERSSPLSRELTPTPLDERPLITLADEEVKERPPQSDEVATLGSAPKPAESSNGDLVEKESRGYFTSAALSSPPFDKSPRRHFRPDNISLVTSPQSPIDIPPEQTRIPEVDTGMQATVEQILSIVQTQQQEITEMKQQLRQQQAFQNQAVVRMLHEEMKRIESVVTTRVQTALVDHAKEENQRLEKALRERHQADKKKQEQLQNTVSQSLTNAVAGKVEKAVKGEMKNSVVPAVQKLLAPVQEQMSTTITQKLTAADTVLKDSIGKMVRSKPVVDSIGAAAASALQGPIQVGYREAFQNTILPSFEKATQSMFQQINDSFQRGTQQYLQQVSASFNQLAKEQKEAREPIVQQLQCQVQEFQTASEKLSSRLEMSVEGMIQSQFSSLLQSHREELLTKLQEETLQTIQETVGRDVREILMEHTQQLSEMSAIDRSRQADPMQQQMRITRLLEQGAPAEAFQEALTAEDLQLVVHVCENVDPADLFSQSPLPLAQPILLSLIQQLSVDLSTNTDLKHRYLEEALMALDADDEVTREHLPTVLYGLQQQLSTTLRDCPVPMQKKLRMLLMLAQSLMK